MKGVVLEMSNQFNLKPKSANNIFVDEPNPGLRAYFRHVKDGSDDEYRTTFFKGKTLEDILAGWEPTVKRLATEWPSLLEFENDLRAKVGPMSIMKPLAARLDDIESYYSSILLESVPISDAAIAATTEWFSPILGLRLRSVSKTLEAMKKSTNSGLPQFEKRRLVADWVKDTTAFQYMTHTYIRENLGVHEIMETAAILGWRGQEGGPSKDDVKQRVVWMFPFAVNLQELRVYQPLIAACQKHNLVPAWISMESVDSEITKLFDTKGKDDLIIATDFSKFDQHFNQDMQNCSYAILRRILSGKVRKHTPHEAMEWLDKVFPIKYNIPLMVQRNAVFYGPHGMGSGSGGTNADETLAHRALQYEVALNHGQILNPHSMCLGDDGILSYPGITVDDVVQAYSSHGQVMNTDKQYASKLDTTYLRRWHHTDYRIDGVCVGVYSTYRALGRLAEQERYYDPEVWGPKAVALRQLSILENCKYHPLREEFVDYCMKGDKYRLGLDIPGFFDNLGQMVKEYTELMPDFMGYTKSLQNDGDPKMGIENWWIVKYLKSKA
nr:RNA-dependent RNA polymerase [Marmot picobirnavirus]